jgi:hypothetical protein
MDQLDYLQKMIEIRLERDGHTNPSKASEKIMSSIRLLSHDELSTDSKEEELGPFKFSRKMIETIINEENLYSYAVIARVRHSMCLQLDIGYLKYDTLLSQCFESGLLQLKEEKGCYVNIFGEKDE